MTYGNFIANIKNSRPNEYFQYSECHHITPRCLGGTDDPDNLIYLTMREHYIAHKLLVEENQGNDKLAQALWRMSNNRGECTPEEYEYSRMRYIDTISGDKNPAKSEEVREKLKGRTPMLGKKHSPETIERMRLVHSQISEETREKMSKARLGKKHSSETIELLKNIPHTEEWNAKVSDALKGIPKSESHRESLSRVERNEEWRARLSAAHKGKVLSEEHKKRISESTKNIPKSEEAREKMRKPKSEEHKKNISEAMKNRVFNRECVCCKSKFTTRGPSVKICDNCREKESSIL